SSGYSTSAAPIDEREARALDRLNEEALSFYEKYASLDESWEAVTAEPKWGPKQGGLTRAAIQLRVAVGSGILPAYAAGSSRDVWLHGRLRRDELVVHARIDGGTEPLARSVRPSGRRSAPARAVRALRGSEHLVRARPHGRQLPGDRRADRRARPRNRQP